MNLWQWNGVHWPVFERRQLDQVGVSGSVERAFSPSWWCSRLSWIWWQDPHPYFPHSYATFHPCLFSSHPSLSPLPLFCMCCNPFLLFPPHPHPWFFPQRTRDHLVSLWHLGDKRLLHLIEQNHVHTQQHLAKHVEEWQDHVREPHGSCLLILTTLFNLLPNTSNPKKEKHKNLKLSVFLSQFTELHQS